MIAPFFFAFVGVQAPPSTAGLHPQDTVVFLETPDMAALLEAYRRAPLVQMVQDATVRESVTDLLASTEIDVSAHVAQACAKLGLPETIAQAPVATLLGYLRGVSAFSFSLSIAENDLRAMVGSLLECQKELDVINGRVGEFGKSHGALPETLDELALDEELATDAWGRPYDYRRAQGAAEGFEVFSYGSDGKPGGMGLASDLKYPLVVYEPLEAELPGLIGASLIVDFRTEEAATQALAALRALTEKGGVPLGTPAPFARVGAKSELYRAKLPDLPDVPAWVLRNERRIALGFGRATPELFAGRLESKSPALASSESYLSLEKRLPPPAGVTVFHGFAQLDGLRGILEQMGGDAADATRWATSTVVRMQLVDERFVTEFASGPPPPGDLFSDAVSCTPLPPGILAFVPEEAVAAYATTIDPLKLYQALTAEIRDASGEGSGTPSMLDEMEQRYGFDLENDVFASLGTGVVAFLLPITGVPGAGVVIELKDTEKFQHGLSGLLALLEAQAGGEFQVKSKPYRDVPMWSFSFAEETSGGFGVAAISPSIAIVKNHLLITLTSTRAKKEIKRALGEEGSPHALLTLATPPPKDATAVGYMDWAGLTQGVYGMGRTFLPLAMAGREMPIDLAALPPDASVFVHFFKPTLLWSRRPPGGIYTRIESSFGPETWLALAGLGAGAAVMISSDSAPPPPSAPMSPSSSSAPPKQAGSMWESANNASASATRVSMRYLATRLAVYRLDTKHFPAELEALVRPTPEYPHGFIESGTLPLDGWGRAFRYRVNGDGETFQLWSVGADGVDQDGHGDDLVGD